jgi:formate transporter
MAWASRRVSSGLLLRNWGIVYAGNFVGAFGTALLVWLGKQYTFGDGSVGITALSIASTKTELGFGQAIVLGALCNALVCLAVWLTYGAHTTADKILAVIPPIAAFVALGFEHSVANMYFIPVALLIKTDQAWIDATPGVPDLGDVTWGSFLFDNLLPVTIGNVMGGGIMVGAVYWFVYLRRRPETSL